MNTIAHADGCLGSSEAQLFVMRVGSVPCNAGLALLPWFSVSFCERLEIADRYIFS